MKKKDKVEIKKTIKENKKDSEVIPEINYDKELKTLNKIIEELSSENKNLISQIQNLTKEKDESHTMYMKVAREKQEMYHVMKDSEEKQIKKSMQDIIFVVKQLDYILKNIPPSETAFNEIQNLQNNTTKRLFDSYGVIIYKPEIGKKFDPTKERVISVEKTSDSEKDETIANVLSNGFIKDNRIINEALVCVFQAEQETINEIISE